MGMDISIATNPFSNHDTINEVSPLFGEYNLEGYNFGGYRLSRSFAVLMHFQLDSKGQTDLDAIGSVTGVDISPLSQMANYHCFEGIDLELYIVENANTKSEKRQMLKEAEKGKQILENNLEKALQTVTDLLEKVSQIQYLPRLLKSECYYLTLDDKYFANLSVDALANYHHNNFIQDLRNCKRFLEYAKSNGATTVWFNFSY